MKLLLYLGCPPAERPDMDVLLRSAGFAVRWIDSAPQALMLLDERVAPLVVDLRSPHAIPAAIEVRDRRIGVFIIGVDDPRRPDAGERARRAGLVHLLPHPLVPEQLAAAVWAGERAEQDADGGDAGGPGGDIVARSSAMKEVLESVRRASADPAGGVLLAGEPGSGRRFMARALHDLNRQPGGKLLEVDCAVPAADLQVALFGADPQPGGDAEAAGSAFGPVAQHPVERITRGSLACQAFGGSLLLLNVADMASRLQGRLVRLLRDGEAVLPNGGTVGGPLRAMACVEPGFDAVVREGRVRPDLFKRLVATRIDVPPLRDRREDIPALVEHFLQDICLMAQVTAKTMSEAALALLASLPYRGNARELRALVAMLVERTEGPVIGLDDVLRHLQLDVAGAPMAAACNGTLRHARAQFEQQYIREVLERHHGRIAEAAKSLGIQRTNLYRKMRSLGVVRRAGGNGSGSPAH